MPLCGIKLTIDLINVVLPAPLGPTMPTICPFISWKETSCNASVLFSYVTDKFLYLT